ncbi:conserved Plasmodium protein, unknown function [Plasmodium ovale curtisi]|uniref:Uncharacterized protein n=1 Tax=Plasmodium ovale curtisi TaxID=864141 RepID=A0A1A8WRW8_PLAOA|nr:conserved Plasmodium protein, unknown function [Plasmodium ovale curtisi]
MDSFIDEEITSADENEPVLLDIKDLLNLKEKNEKKSRKDKHLQIASNSYYIPKMETQDMSDDASTFLIHKEDNERNGNNDKNSVYSSKWGAYYQVCCCLGNFCNTHAVCRSLPAIDNAGNRGEISLVGKFFLSMFPCVHPYECHVYQAYRAPSDNIDFSLLNLPKDDI